MNETNVNEKIQEVDPQTSRHSKLTYASFGMYQFTWTIIVSSQNLFLYFYYHTVVGLDPLLIFLATAITTVWAALNDPFIGFLTDRNFKWTRKWGRRFPWLIIGGLVWSLSFILLFSAPDVEPSNPWAAFWWLIMALFVTDTFMTLSDVNAATLRSDKFRTETERRRYSSIFGPFDMIAQVIGMTVPPLLIGFGTGKSAYLFMGIFVAVLGIIFVILFLPGAREDKIIIDRYYSEDYERAPFFKGIGDVLKQKSFLAFIAHYTCFSIATTIMTAIVVYATTFILRVSSEIMTVLFAIFLLGALTSVPFWLRMFKKANNNKKVYTIGSFVLCLALIPMTFFQSIIDFGIFMFIGGFAMGCVWTSGIPWIYSSVHDDFVVRTGRNQKGVLVGTWAIFTLVTAFIDEAIISTVYGLTGFVAGYDTYEALEAVVPDMTPILWGIRFLIGVIPSVVILIGTIIFWRFFPLTQDKILENKSKLIELGF